MFIKAYSFDLEFPERNNELKGVLRILAVGFFTLQKMLNHFAH